MSGGVTDSALGERGRELLAGRPGRAGEELEIYEKRGRSSSMVIDRSGESALQSVEAGWAVRAGDHERSWFASGSGELPLALERPEASAIPLRLPPPLPARPEFSLVRGLDAPLASGAEGRALLGGIARELARELDGARLTSARLDDGISEAALFSSRGVVATVRSRSAALRLEARCGVVEVEVGLVARSATEMKPLGVARRIADRLAALDAPEGSAWSGRLLLASPVAARLVEALAPRLVGAEAREIRRAAELGGVVAASGVTILDDGGRPEGLLAAAVDGEGVPTRTVRLVDRGRFVRPLTAWWESAGQGRVAGCSLRPGWRDLPRRGPTEFWIEPHSAVAVADLLGEAEAFLIAAEGVATVDRDGDRFTMPVSGYRLDRGRASAPLGPGRLVGSLSAWLLGIRSVARDLGFVPGVALYGAPGLLVDGLEWVPGRGR